MLRRMVMRRLLLFGRYLCREVSLLEADGFAVLGSLDEVWHLCHYAEHQQFAYGGQDRAVDDAHRREQKASCDKQEANCKGDVEDFHSDGEYVSYGYS